MKSKLLEEFKNITEDIRYVIGYVLDSTNKTRPWKPSTIQVLNIYDVSIHEERYWWRKDGNFDTDSGMWIGFDDSEADYCEEMKDHAECLSAVCITRGYRIDAQEITVPGPMDAVNVYDTYEDALSAFNQEIDDYVNGKSKTCLLGELNVGMLVDFRKPAIADLGSKDSIKNDIYCISELDSDEITVLIKRRCDKDAKPISVSIRFLEELCDSGDVKIYKEPEVLINTKYMFTKNFNLNYKLPEFSISVRSCVDMIVGDIVKIANVGENITLLIGKKKVDHRVRLKSSEFIRLITDGIIVKCDPDILY